MTGYEYSIEVAFAANGFVSSHIRARDEDSARKMAESYMRSTASTRRGEIVYTPVRRRPGEKWEQIPVENDSAAYELAGEAAERVDYRLTYARTGPRLFTAIDMKGPDIPDAYEPGETATGDWMDIPDAWPDSSDAWVERFFQRAVSEGVHEVLEWFQVDGKTFLDPHSVHEDRILDLTKEFVHKLVDLREKTSE